MYPGFTYGRRIVLDVVWIYGLAILDETEFAVESALSEVVGNILMILSLDIHITMLATKELRVLATAPVGEDVHTHAELGLLIRVVVKCGNVDMSAQALAE